LAATNIGLTRYLTGMAKRRYTKKGNKIQPAVMTLTFATPSVTGGATGRSYIDLSQVASLVNRRFYRQGINWAVGGFKVLSAQPGMVNIGKLPNTWVMSNAWEKGFRAWQEMNNKALEESPSVRPKFLDFKIYADATHHQAGSVANLLPVDLSGNQATPGEWIYSSIVTPITSGGASTPGQVAEFEIIATGDNFPGAAPASTLDAVSLIKGYANSRGLPNVLDPNAPGDAEDIGGFTPENWISAIFNEGTDQDSTVIDDMTSENNIAPYPFENDGINTDTQYPGGANQLPGLEWHDLLQIYETNVTNGVGIQRAKGGNFPCGLIAIDWLPVNTSNLVVQIDLVPGYHRGYLCEPMTEM
jgi:hypothetical protein